MPEKLTIDNYFTKDARPIKYTKSDVDIIDDNSNVLFVQKGVEYPEYFSNLARKLVSSRYFYGENGTPERESSFKQLTERVTGTISNWGVNQGYFDEAQAKLFKEEIEQLALTQCMSFNSPVWFNVGTHIYPSRKHKHEKENKRESYIIKDEKAKRIPSSKEHFYPQTSACFIQSVDDTMESIMDLATREAMLFKYGSGTGTDLSTLRSSKERLSGGGKPSGPLAYEVFYDKVAGIVKSGGKTRRAAKMNSLRVDHPDIKEFIECKTIEQKKIEILMDHGGLTYKEAVDSVNYQNANLSVRLTNDFMDAVLNDGIWQTIPVHNKEMIDKMPKYKAKELFNLIAKGTWACGDPGAQYHDTINAWHTCKSSDSIHASNPCSEYMFIDNSSCNLASQNLRAFMNMDGTFDINKFSNAVRLTAIAQDLLYDNSRFPTKEIAQNSHNFRPLGMGYANLGSLVMSLGLPYDSDEARAIAASITALMTGKVYETSTEIAEKIGTFKEYEKNKKSMIEVMHKHKAALKTIDKSKLPKGLENILEEAERVWDNVIKRGSKYGFRNAQATVLAPTGTIGFAMDCDTKGIEPEIGLVQYKKLAEGGSLTLINGTVPIALTKLGYSQEQINEIKKYIDKNLTIEGAPYLKEEHLAIFDCANKPDNGKRTISTMGHIKMMAAVQPFLSGAISKTVNMPKEATVEEIENVYMEAWKLGLKAVAIYRDGSKRAQPLSFKKGGIESKLGNGPVRRKMPTTRQGVIHKFDVAGHEGYLTVGLYEGTNIPGEIFINMSKEGSIMGGTMDVFATSVSLGLQYGVPLEALVKKFRYQKFEPYGFVREGHPEIKSATSIIDYIFNFLGKSFVEGYENNMNGNNTEAKQKEDSKSDVTENKTKKEVYEELGGFCPECQSQMVKKGHCQEVCKCGFVKLTGCGN